MIINTKENYKHWNFAKHTKILKKPTRTALPRSNSLHPSTLAPPLHTPPAERAILPSLRSCTHSIRDILPSLRSCTHSIRDIFPSLRSCTHSTRDILPSLRSCTHSIRDAHRIITHISPMTEGSCSEKKYILCDRTELFEIFDFGYVPVSKYRQSVFFFHYKTKVFENTLKKFTHSYLEPKTFHMSYHTAL